MSRSQPALTNPAQHFFTWSGSKGQLEFYDKEKQERIKVPLPFEFLVLDELATITGFSEQDKSSYWSNEVKSLKDEFTVKTSGGTKQIGLYQNLADVRAKGAKYAKSIYIAHKNKAGEYIIGNLKASGAALTAWIELGSKQILQNGKVTVTGSTEGKKGTTVYQIPNFEWTHSDNEEDTAAIELDKELQIYLSQYLAANQSESQVDNSWNEVDQSVGLATDEQLADFEARKRQKLSKNDDDGSMERVHQANPLNTDIVIEDIGEEINLDEISF